MYLGHCTCSALNFLRPAISWQKGGQATSSEIPGSEVAAASSQEIPELPERCICEETGAMCHLVGKPRSLMCFLTERPVEMGDKLKGSPTLPSVVGKRRAGLGFYLTFVSVGWFLRASANALAPSSPTWLPHILVKTGNQEKSGVLPCCPSASRSLPFSPFPSPYHHFSGVEACKKAGTNHPHRARHVPLPSTTPSASLTHQYPKATAQETACCSANAFGISLLCWANPPQPCTLVGSRSFVICAVSCCDT